MHLRPCSIVVLRLPPCTGNTLLNHPLGQQGLASSAVTAQSGRTSSGEGKERKAEHCADLQYERERGRAKYGMVRNKTARCYLTKQKIRGKKAEQPHGVPASTESQMGELKECNGYDWWLNKADVTRMKYYIKLQAS